MQMVGWMAYPSTQPLSSLRKYCWPLPVIFVVTRSSVTVVKTHHGTEERA